MILIEKMIPFIDAATPEVCSHCGNKITSLSEQAAHYIKQALLSDPAIVEIDPDAELPENPYCKETAYKYHRKGVEYYKSLLAGWVKPK